VGLKSNQRSEPLTNRELSCAKETLKCDEISGEETA